jgi:hypothetical protein
MKRELRDDLMILEGMMRAFGFFLEQPQFDCFDNMHEIFSSLSEELLKKELYESCGKSN